MSDLGRSRGGPTPVAVRPSGSVSTSASLPEGRHSVRRVIGFERALRYVAMAGLAALIFVVPWEDQVYEEGAVRLSKVFGLAAFAAAFPALFFHGRNHRLIDVHWFAAAYAAVAVAGVTWSEAEGRIDFAFTTVQLVAMMWLIWEFVDTRPKVQLALGAFAAGAMVNAVAVIHQFHVIGETTEGKFGRYSGGPLADPNDVASVLALGVPMVWYLANTLQSRLLRLVALAFIPPAVYAVSLTGSRGGFVVLVAGLAVIPATMSSIRVPGRILLVAALAVGVVLAPSLLPEEQFERAINEDDSGVAAKNADSRWTLFSEALNGFEANWKKGVGSDGSKGYLEEFTTKEGGQGAHNTPANVGLQLGLLGLVPFLFVVVAVGRRASQGPVFARRVALGLFLGSIVMMMPAHVEATKRLWMVLGLVLCLATHTAVSKPAQSAD